MYKIEKTDYGFKNTFWGFIRNEELAKWYKDIDKALKKSKDSFSLHIDTNNLKNLPSNSIEIFGNFYKIAGDSGLERIAVTFNDISTSMKLKQIALETGSFEKARFINVLTNPEWEFDVSDWLINSIPPESKEDNILCV